MLSEKKNLLNRIVFGVFSVAMLFCTSCESGAEEEPETPGDDSTDGDICGTYTVKVGYKTNNTPSTSTETITITENNDDKGQYKITGMFDQYGTGGGTYYANYVDGILTVLSANADNMYIGSLSADINMVLSDISFYSPDGVEAGSYGYVLTSYSASKQ